MLKNEICSFLEQNSSVFSRLQGKEKIEIKGTQNGERAFLVSTYNNPILYVVSSLIQAQEMKHIFSSYGKKCLILTDCLNSLAHELTFPQGKTELIGALKQIYTKNVDIVICFVGLLCQRVPQKHLYTKNVINIEVGETVNFEQLIKSLINLGYERVEEIDAENQFRVRGDTLDFSIAENKNLRIEFFGEEVESIRIVNADFKTMEKLQQFSFLPNCLTFGGGLENLALKNEETESLIEWFNNGYVVLDEPSRLFPVLEKTYATLKQEVTNRIEEKILPQQFEFLYFQPQVLMLDNIKKIIAFESLDVNNKFFIANSEYVSCAKSKKYFNDLTQFYTDIAYYDRLNCTIIICVQDELGEKIVKFHLNEMHLSFKVGEKIVKNAINIMRGTINAGFSFLDDNFIFFTTLNFDGYIKKQIEQQSKTRVFYLPKVGDYVVHEKYGIAKCKEISRLNFGISEKDYFVLEYAKGGILYIPSEHVNELSSYIGEENPKLDTLGSDSFKKAKEKAKASVKKIAYDLKKLYALRESRKGYKYEINSEILQEFISSFGFELTVDQKSAIEDALKDMENAKIMERLVCGDVGFGKTEVAFVVAFATILNAKQVAVLVPTSVLCNQHFNNFKKKMEGFGVKVAMLSRFQTSKQNNEVIKKLKSGEIDVVCGTKRMLSSDVEFNNLGLLILDEEQRFGVNDKEKIKNIKQDINVLTLSATPIPRTLNMSLMGVRDISLITTPPENRKSVQTMVCEENDVYIADACKQELARGGQVLIIYNRVETIFEVANKIKHLIPEAKVGVAHGQMTRVELENAIMKLYSGETQIMVATTLIENGVDLPLANTLIVLDAQNFGLSQLYQLRGRVGRSSRKAYAVFMYKKGLGLTVGGYERLKAIKEFSSLGSGFKLAMRDLELRGAGEILGASQHGHIVKIGYDMYCKLIEETLKELNGEEQIELKDIHIDVNMPALIPQNFIENEEERIKIYNKISFLRDDIEVVSLTKMLEETYGKIPAELNELMQVAILKNVGQQLKIKKIEIKKDCASIEFYEKPNVAICELILNENLTQNVLNPNKFETKIANNLIKNQNIIKKCINTLKNN